MAEHMTTTGVTIESSMIRRLPTRLHVLCPLCHHQGHVETFLDKPPKLVCSKCGNRNPIVAARDRSRAWANRRRGK